MLLFYFQDQDCATAAKISAKAELINIVFTRYNRIRLRGPKLCGLSNISMP